MLWSVTKPTDPGLYWLDTIHKDFYRGLFSGNTFNNCFITSFNTVLRASSKTKRRFQTVFTLFNELEAVHQNTFKNIYNNHLNYRAYFASTRVGILRPSEEHNALWEAVKKLGGYLYATTIDLVCYKTAAVGNPSMDEHYECYKSDNNIVCCFCGTEEMMEERLIEPEEGAENDDEKQWRASYDHFLPKKHYPFLAVDFDNLIPCCQKCNEKAKGELDVLEYENTRTLAFFPYHPTEVVSLEATATKFLETRNIRIDIVATGDPSYEKADTWNRTFKVLTRVNKRLKSFNESWLAPVLQGVTDARTKLNQEKARCDRFKKSERDAYFKALCFDEISTKTDKELTALLETVEQIYSPRQSL
ncbi:MAG: hypothetical protein ACJAXJ_001767 [Colwellia sp.]|jgi:hypothetical protein